MTTVSNSQYVLDSVSALREHYDAPSDLVVHKQVDRLDAGARQFIDASPFLVMATSSSQGVDCSPKGDAPGFVQVLDDRTLVIPDRAGNNRIDGLQNIVENGAIGLIFFVPGMPETFRVNGDAQISVDPQLLSRFAGGKRPAKSAIVVTVREAFLHCGRALTHGGLWDVETQSLKERAPDLRAMLQAHVAYSKEKAAACDDE